MNPWDKRYATAEYIYGEEPNEYLREKLKDLPVGKILLPADGEGRNSVYAASLGWKTFAFDGSKEGKRKAEILADKKGVKIDYTVSRAEEADYPQDSFDALVLIYAHFPGNRTQIHRHLSSFLKKGGVLILEAFNKNQTENQKVNPKAGGPPNPDMLYDLEEIKDDFKDFEFIEAKNAEVILSEGDHHVGKGDVVRIFAVKK